ncbi:MAG: hypothetical protein J0I10_23105 [Verrucomicrobia bacterium]|nr:hypothetical protein [Verrucomicrobiota bacterium]
MKLDQTDACGLFPLVRILPMVGNPVEENPIDLLFNRFFELEGTPLRFLKIRVERAEDLGVCLEGARKMGFAGFAITVPYKMAIVPHCDEILESSQGVGAVNFVTFEGPERRAVGKTRTGSRSAIPSASRWRSRANASSFSGRAARRAASGRRSRGRGPPPSPSRRAMSRKASRWRRPCGALAWRRGSRRRSCPGADRSRFPTARTSC